MNNFMNSGGLLSLGRTPNQHMDAAQIGPMQRIAGALNRTPMNFGAAWPSPMPAQGPAPPPFAGWANNPNAQPYRPISRVR